MNIAENIYVIYNTENNVVIGTYYDKLHEANNLLKLLKTISPDNTYQLVVYRRCMDCDA